MVCKVSWAYDGALIPGDGYVDEWVPILPRATRLDDVATAVSSVVVQENLCYRMCECRIQWQRYVDEGNMRILRDLSIP